MPSDDVTDEVRHLVSRAQTDEPPRSPTTGEVLYSKMREGRHLKSGAQFVLDDPAALDPIWGRDDEVLWASGEPLLIVGPTGVGKTTLALLLLAGRLGIAPDVLGWPVKESEQPILYLAQDRPRQIRRAMCRTFGEQHRDILEERLKVWEGPLPFDLGKIPEQLLETVDNAGAGTVFIDSLKDAAVKLTDDEVGGNLNRAVQGCITAGIEVTGLHHQRKGQAGAKPNTLEDVYGSTWITAGAGSVVLLWGAAGDPLVELTHLKQPAQEIGPLRVEFDHAVGTSSVYHGQVDLLPLLRRSNGITPTELARMLFDTEKPSDTQRKKAQRRLDRLCGQGVAHRQERDRGDDGTLGGVRYYATTDRQEELA